MGEEIQRKLDELHDHLDQVSETDEGDLKDALRDYQAGESSDDEHHALVERLREATLRYEVSHPELSRFIAGLVDRLTAVGL